MYLFFEFWQVLTFGFELILDFFYKLNVSFFISFISIYVFQDSNQPSQSTQSWIIYDDFSFCLFSCLFYQLMLILKIGLQEFSQLLIIL